MGSHYPSNHLWMEQWWFRWWFRSLVDYYPFLIFFFHFFIRFLFNVFYILLFFAIITAGFIFKMMSSVILPVIISIMLSFVLLPVINKLRKFHIPWLISCIIVIILFVTVFIGFSSLLANSLTKLTYEFPKYESKFMGMYQIIAELFNLDIDNSKSFLEKLKLLETVIFTGYKLFLIMFIYID